MEKTKILTVVGTRPEVIKMAPVIEVLKKDPLFSVEVLSTAQHRQMLDQMLSLFQIIPDADLDVMQKNQSLSGLSSALFTKIDDYLIANKPSLVLSQGDTTTAFIMSLCCFYRKIPFAHVEAGLRTNNLHDPFPEEMNRTLIGHLSALNFAPTQKAVDNLIKQGTKKETIFLTGNTVVDSLFSILKKNIALDGRFNTDKKIVLITCHRRESWGEKLNGICQAIKELASLRDDALFIFPVHPNPNVKEVVENYLKGVPRILLIEPLDYAGFVTLMKKSHLILTDSGGVQEEAPSLGVPVLVLRETTERQEAIDAGCAKLIGTNPKTIVEETLALLNTSKSQTKLENSPFGDGKASEKIHSIIKNFLFKL